MHRGLAEEAVALHSAAQCPEKTGTLILGGSQFGLQIHESVGHPSNSIACSARKPISPAPVFSPWISSTTCVTPRPSLMSLRMRDLEHGAGLGTFAYDDEGVPAQCIEVIKNGEFSGYLSSRETAHLIGLPRSGGTMRTEGWNRLPMIRMTNISILPGDWTLRICSPPPTMPS